MLFLSIISSKLIYNNLLKVLKDINEHNFTEILTQHSTC